MILYHCSGNCTIRRSSRETGVCVCMFLCVREHVCVLGEESVVGKLQADTVNRSGQTERRSKGGEMLNEG